MDKNPLSGNNIWLQELADLFRHMAAYGSNPLSLEEFGNKRGQSVRLRVLAAQIIVDLRSGMKLGMSLRTHLEGSLALPLGKSALDSMPENADRADFLQIAYAIENAVSRSLPSNPPSTPVYYQVFEKDRARIESILADSNLSSEDKLAIKNSVLRIAHVVRMDSADNERN